MNLLSDAALCERAFKDCSDLRCAVTGHLVGTDTWIGTAWCQCDYCFTVKRVWEGYIALRDAAWAERREAIDKLERDICMLTQGQMRVLLLDRLAAIRSQR